MQRWERIARRVDTEMHRPRLTKGSLAKALDMSRPALDRRLRSGKPAWSYDQLEKLASMLGITVAELVGDEEFGENDLRIETHRRGVPGNETAIVVIHHLPTGAVGRGQSERSELQAKSDALRNLRADIFNITESAANRTPITDG